MNRGSNWFEDLRETLESAYLAADNPRGQSGFRGGAVKWERLRRPAVECIETSGAFLDIGCANGYFLECAVRWAAERDVFLEPYGIDLSEKLVLCARARFPACPGHFHVANGFEWIPPRTFEYVRTELVYVPAECERTYIAHLLQHYLAPDGVLLICNYAEQHPKPERTVVSGCSVIVNLDEHLTRLGVKVDEYRYGFCPDTGRRMCVAVMRVR